jgi:hypothetical protein
MIHHYGGTSHAVFTALTKSLLFNINLEPYKTQYSFINRIRQLVASIQTIGDKRITVLPIAPPHHHHPHRLTTRNQCLKLLEMIDVEFNTAYPLVQRCTSSNTIIESIILHGITQYSLLHRVAADFRMHDCYI